MPRLILKILCCLVLPPLAASLAVGLVSGAAWAAALAPGAFSGGDGLPEALAILAGQFAAETVENTLFLTVLSLPPLVAVGPPAYLLTAGLKRWRRSVLIATGAVTGALWGALVDHYDSYFTPPGINAEWVAGGAAFGALVAAIALALLRRAGPLRAVQV